MVFPLDINLMKWFIGARIKYIITNPKIKPNDGTDQCCNVMQCDVED